MIGKWALCAALVLASACAPRGPAESVVDLVRVSDGWRYCSAFAIETSRGLRLYTAAHCTHTLGSERLWYFEAGGGFAHEARVEDVNAAADRAVLVPSSNVAPIARGDVAGRGEYVHVLSSMGRVDGRVLGRGGYYLQTDLDVYPGWSGSPVLDARGRAVGVLVACVGTTANGTRGKGCEANTGIFVGLDWPSK